MPRRRFSAKILIELGTRSLLCRLVGIIIRRDQHVREAIRKQSSLLTRYPNTEAAQDIQAIAQRLIQTF